MNELLAAFFPPLRVASVLLAAPGDDSMNKTKIDETAAAVTAVLFFKGANKHNQMQSKTHTHTHTHVQMSSPSP